MNPRRGSGTRSRVTPSGSRQGLEPCSCLAHSAGILKGPNRSSSVLLRCSLCRNPDRSTTTEREQQGLGEIDQAQSKTPCLGGRLRARGSLVPWVGPSSYWPFRH